MYKISGRGQVLKSFLKVPNFVKYLPQQNLKLLDWAIFNLIIGNADAHGKNISYFVKHSGISIAPYYDLLSIVMHEGVDHDLAMSFGDEFHIDRVAGYPLRAFCEETGLNPKLVSARIKMLCKTGSREKQ